MDPKPPGAPSACPARWVMMRRAVWLILTTAAPLAAHAQPVVSFQKEDGCLRIKVRERPFAVYVWNDPKIPRPYFSDIHSVDGLSVTRNNPPIEGKDATDHATFHPGLWMAFGDLSGADFWRNKARVVHAGFAEEPTARGNTGTFTVLNKYKMGESTICDELCRIEIVVQADHVLIDWKSTFQSKDTLVFGDQEEMGLGVRVATGLSVERGGVIVNANAQINEKQAWGQASAWCDYSGVIEGKPVGVAFMPDPANFRPSWFHVRDYGLMVANPFGRNALAQGEISRVVVKPDQAFALRFGVLIHSGFADPQALHGEWIAHLKSGKP